MKRLIVLIAVWAQSLVAQNVTETFQGTPLPEVLQRLQEVYRYQFSYIDEHVQDVRVDAEFRDADIRSVLRAILRGTDLSYRVNGDHVIVIFRSGVRSDDLASLSGTIADRETREVLPAANVIFPETLWGASADRDGRFIVSGIPPGSYRVRINVIGYEMFEDTIDCVGSVDLDTIWLIPKTLEGEEVVITGQRAAEYRAGDAKLDIQPSILVLRRAEINRSPGLLEPDLFRSLQNLPGITTTSDVSNEIYVRGGTPDQNLIMLDRTVVYQPYHLFGIAGIFNPDLIDQVYVSTGGFSSEYGTRLSSVIDVRSRVGEPGRVNGAGSVSLLSSKLTLFGRPTADIDYVASYRRTYLDWASSLIAAAGIIPEGIPYYFQDGYLKVQRRVGATQKVGASVFFSEDHYEQRHKKWAGTYDDNTRKFTRYPYYFSDNSTFMWYNLNGSLFLEMGKAETGLHQLTLSRASTSYDLDQDQFWRATASAPDSIRRRVDSLDRVEQSTPFDARNRLTDYSVRWDSEIPMGTVQWFLGAQVTALETSYRWKHLDWDNLQAIQVFYDNAPDSFRYSNKSKYAAIYSDVSIAWDDWTFKPGLRLEYYRFSKPSVVVGPRVAVRWEMSDAWTWKAAGGLYYQSQFTARERGYVGFSEISFSSYKLPLQKAVHMIVGAEREQGLWKFTGDIYGKRYDHLHRRVLSSPLTLEFEQGHSNAVGLELTAARGGRGWTIEGTYALAYVDRNFNGARYFPNHDQRHTIMLNVSWSLPRQWELSSRWAFNTGRAYRPTRFYGISGEFEYDQLYLETETPTFQELEHLNYCSRLPIYHRLDISLTKTIRYKKWTLRPFLNILNVYYNTNPLYFERAYSSDTKFTNEPFPRYLNRVTLKPYGMPIIPTFGASFEF